MLDKSPPCAELPKDLNPLPPTFVLSSGNCKSIFEIAPCLNSSNCMSNPTPDACVVDAVACVYVCPVFLYASASIEVPVDQTSSTVASPLWLLTVAV